MNKFIKNIFIKITRSYSNTVDALMTKRFADTPTAGIILICALLICVLVASLGISPLTTFIGRLFCVLLFGLLTFLTLEGKTPIIKKLSGGTALTYRDFFKQMTHKSYLYGLLVFSFELWYMITSLFYLISMALFDSGLLLPVKPTVIIIMFAFTFVYFTYHIYSNPENSLPIIQHRIDFYVAIGTSIGFVMLITSEIRDVKIFFSGLALVFTWLKYLISSEKLSSTQIVEKP